MLGADAVKEVARFLLSNNTIAKRIVDMYGNIESNILEKNHIGGKFAIQVDKSTDISGHTQLLVNVRFVDEDVVKEYFFFCEEIATEYKRRRNCLCCFRLY